MSYVYTTLATDTFHRANEDPLNSKAWTPPSGYAAMQVLNNECVPTNYADGSGGIYTGITWPANQWAQFQIGQLIAGSNAALAMIMRFVDSNNFYAIEIDGPLGSDCDVNINKFVGGTIQSITGIPRDLSLTVDIGDTFKMAWFGSQCTVFHNGMTIASGTDTTFASGSVGLLEWGNTAVTDAQISSFSGGRIFERPALKI